jgi:plastocyanin
VLLALAAACGGGGGGDDAGDDTGGNLSSGDNAANDAAGGQSSTTADPDVTLPDEMVELTTEPAEVRAIDNSFDAPGVKVAAGTTVRWTNAGRQDHDVIPAEGSEWGAEVEAFHPGDTYEHTFEEPGTYNYYCTIHGTAAKGMVGVVVVE